jgi:hypothetical protein
LDELRAAGFGGDASRAAFGDRPAAILHSLSGPVDYVAAALELGCAISISGLCFRKGEEATAESVRLVPADRLLVETDAPYLSAPGAPRRRNEPAWVRVTAAWVADQGGPARRARRSARDRVRPGLRDPGRVGEGARVGVRPRVRPAAARRSSCSPGGGSQAPRRRARRC